MGHGLGAERVDLLVEAGPAFTGFEVVDANHCPRSEVCLHEGGYGQQDLGKGQHELEGDGDEPVAHALQADGDSARSIEVPGKGPDGDNGLLRQPQGSGLAGILQPTGVLNDPLVSTVRSDDPRSVFHFRTWIGTRSLPTLKHYPRNSRSSGSTIVCLLTVMNVSLVSRGVVAFLISNCFLPVVELRLDKFGGGADAIVVSGGYEDDNDDGDEIIYTGQGGNDPDSGKQVADQEPPWAGTRRPSVNRGWLAQKRPVLASWSKSSAVAPGFTGLEPVLPGWRRPTGRGIVTENRHPAFPCDAAEASGHSFLRPEMLVGQPL